MRSVMGARAHQWERARKLKPPPLCYRCVRSISRPMIPDSTLETKKASRRVESGMLAGISLRIDLTPSSRLAMRKLESQDVSSD